MVEASRQPRDKNYNLIAVLYQSSNNVESLKTYVQDAEQEGDQELLDFFGAFWRTTSRPPSGPRRCSSPGSRTSNSRGRSRTYHRGPGSQKSMTPGIPYYVGA